MSDPEQIRLEEDKRREKNWKRFGPYLSERQWGTVREDYSKEGDVWRYFTHEMAKSRAYRWGEDGLLGFCDRECRLAFALCLWNEKDPILKERLYGLASGEGNHGEDVKESYYYIDSTPTHSYVKGLYQYVQAPYPYEDLKKINHERGLLADEYELEDTQLFDQGHFDLFVEYAKADCNDILIRIEIINQSSEKARCHLLPTLWFRNTWDWHEKAEGQKPSLVAVNDSHIESFHPTLGHFHFVVDQPLQWLFTENETNFEKLYGVKNKSPFVKDAFHNYLVEGKEDAINGEKRGTKCAAHYLLHFEPKQSIVIKARLFSEDETPSTEYLGEDFDKIVALRKKEADTFYESKLSSKVEENAGEFAQKKALARQAYSGLLWNKQFYHYVVRQWLDGDPLQPKVFEERKSGRNADWNHFFARDVLSMPDKWEYPWFASWDLSFQMVALAKIDPELAKQQLLLPLREWYMHPNGAMAAYEFCFGDVNPPVHAWGAWRVYKMSAPRGFRDRIFLEKIFQKLLMNFTWWVNRKDVHGRHLFSGGFLGLDNIGIFNRSTMAQEGVLIEQADATAWMAFYCLTMLAISLELAQDNGAYEDLASKFFEHFIRITDSANQMGGPGLWDEKDGFYYDHIRINHHQEPLRTRSLVGLIPLIAVEVLDEKFINQFSGFKKRMDWFLTHRQDLHRAIAFCNKCAGHEKLLLAISSKERLIRLCHYLLSETEFLSPFGIRSLSKVHDENPYRLFLRGKCYEIKYTPGVSDNNLFGGNSNWRGPVWFPINYLFIEALERYHYFYGDELKVQCPSQTGPELNLKQVAEEIKRRLQSLFIAKEGAQAPYWGEQKEGPYHRFYEYFHADKGYGLGASQQTGWTALIAELLQD